MTKKIKIILTILCVIIIFAAAVLLIKARNISVYDRKSEATRLHLDRIEKDYKNNMRDRYRDAVALVNSDNISNMEVEKLKAKILELTVPPKEDYKQLHVDLAIYALAKLDNFSKTGNQQDKEDGRKIINEIAVKYAWLNN